MKQIIPHRWRSEPCYSCEVSDDDPTPMRTAVVQAILSRADLSRADLSDANLSDANLSRADLSDANLSRADLSRADLSRADLSRADLSRADLSRADLSDANLSRADLSDANLSRADLSDANLSDANLSDANLSDADLSDANLSDANLSDANLSDANLSQIKTDVWAVLDTAPAEAAGLLAAIRDGRIDGSQYTGECACLVGTIANIRGCDYGTLAPNSERPSEKWFLAIRPGHTPVTSQVSAITEKWILEWQANHQTSILAPG